MSIVEKAVDKLRGKAQGHPGSEPDSTAVRAGALSMPPGLGESTDVHPQSIGGDREKAQKKILSLDITALRQQGLFATETMEAQLLEEYRRIKRPLLSLLKKSAVQGANRIMVTSALAGEGKTFTSINLALSLAQEHDLSVLLVDADVVRPTISRALGLERQPGLVDLLSDPAIDPDSAVIPTDWGCLSVLPAGQSRSLMTELLSSQHVEAVLSALEHHPSGLPKILIIDSPPLLQTSESLAIANAAGSVLMVVKAGQTYQHQVLSAVGLLDPEKNVSFVLNQTRPAHGADYYGSYYGYYHRPK